MILLYEVGQSLMQNGNIESVRMCIESSDVELGVLHKIGS